MNIALLNFYKDEATAINKLQYQYVCSDCTKDISINDPKTLEINVSKEASDKNIEALDLDCVLSLQQIRINQLKNLIIKNIDESKYDLLKLKELLKSFGEIDEIKTIEDLLNQKKLICFVNFKDKQAASDCLKTISLSNDYPEWFVNYHIERLEREKLHYQDVKEDGNELLFKKIYIGFSDNKDASSVPKQHNFHSHVNQISNEIKMVVDPTAQKAKGTQLIDFKAAQVYKKLLELMNQKKDDETKYDVQSYHYHKSYCIMKFETHKQATDLIKLLDGATFPIAGNEYTLSVHRAFVYNNHSSNNSHSRKNSYSSRKNSISSFTHGRRPSFFYKDDFTGKRFSETSDSYSFHSPTISPSFSPDSNSPIFTDSPLASSNVPVSPGTTPPPMTIPPSFYYTPQGPSQKNQPPFYNGPPPNHKFVYPRYVTMPVPMPFQMMMPYNGRSNSGPGSNSNVIYPTGIMPSANKWVYPIPLSTQQHSNLYIQNLPLTWSDDDLEKFITSYLRDSEKIKNPESELISYKVITHNFNQDKCEGYSKGYAFVSFTNPLVASKCMNDLNGFELPVEEYKKGKRNILDEKAKDIDSEAEENINYNKCRIKINFAMKRGKSLVIAKNGPISYNKFFIECMEDQLGVRG